MKRTSRILVLVVALCMLLSVCAFASDEPVSLAGTYSDGVNTLVIADDLTFTMETAGENLDGEAFVLLVTGVFSEDGSFVIDGLYDGDINVMEPATDEQIAADEAKVASAFAGGKVEDEGLPGTYTDGEYTLVIADDLTFTMETTGENLDGEAFVLVITGVFSEDGSFVIDGLYDGDINVMEPATDEQIAADEAKVASAFAGGKVGASGEASGEADTSEEAYHAYLKEYVAAVPAVSDDQYLEFEALIDASDYTTMPADMMFDATWWGYAAMTYDEFVAAGGVYEIPAFDPNLTAD